MQVGSASDLLLARERAARVKDTDALPQIRAELLASGALEAADVRGPVAAPAIDVVPDQRVEELLGARPSQRRQRGLWDHAAQLIEGYRERWQVQDDEPLLGIPPSAGTPQAADRDGLERHLARLKRLIAHAPPGP